jgi:hypothetical protein
MSTAVPKKKAKENPIVSMDLDETSQVTEKLLEYLYTDEIDFEDCIPDTIFKLAIVSTLYEIERLGIMCQNHICTNLDIENILSKNC